MNSDQQPADFPSRELSLRPDGSGLVSRFSRLAIVAAIAGCAVPSGATTDDDAAQPSEHHTVQLPDGRVVTLTGARRGDYFASGDMLFPLGGLRAARVEASRKWPTKTIPYVFSSGVDAATRQKVVAGTEPWKALGFAFAEQPETSPLIFVSIQPSGDPFSSNVPVGYSTTLASIYQAGSSCTPHDYAHEWGHVLGLFHEHQRPDRDTYITVDKTYDSSLGGNPTVVDNGGVAHGAYDFDSIMHYDAYGRTNGAVDKAKVRLRPRDGRSLDSFGNALAPSEGDIAALEFLYGPLTHPAPPPPPPPVPVPLYQLYSPPLQDWFYTINPSQRSIAMSVYGYLDYGVAARVDPLPYGNALPFRRMYKGPPQTDHFYTTSLDEFTSVQPLGWQDEGAEGYLYPNTSVCIDCIPLYRYSHFDGWTGDLMHFYTIEGSFRPALEAWGWTFEGAAGYVHAP